jgi:hypothetical protein
MLKVGANTLKAHIKSLVKPFKHFSGSVMWCVVHIGVVFSRRPCTVYFSVSDDEKYRAKIWRVERNSIPLAVTRDMFRVGMHACYLFIL